MLSQAICQHNTFLDVTGWGFFMSCAHISAAMLANRLSLLYLCSISKLTVPYLQLLLAQLLKIAIGEKEDHVFLLLVILAPVICFTPNCNISKQFLPRFII